MTTDSLQAVQAQLNDHGVRDVKFFFNVNAGSENASDVKEEAAFLVKKFLDGETTQFTNFGEILPE